MHLGASLCGTKAYRWSPRGPIRSVPLTHNLGTLLRLLEPETPARPASDPAEDWTLEISFHLLWAYFCFGAVSCPVLGSVAMQRELNLRLPLEQRFRASTGHVLGDVMRSFLYWYIRLLLRIELPQHYMCT